MPDNTSLEDGWLTLVKRLHAISSTGLHFGESDFDMERYQDIHRIATQMLADLGQVPIKTLDDLFPLPGQGYETPKVDVRGAVFQGDSVLLVREKLDGLWTLPGGYADVCISPAENIVKEIAEEASLEVSAKKLYAVIHKARHDYDMDVRDFYKLFFICETTRDQAPRAGLETSDVGFFDLQNLPPLSTGRVIEKHIRLAEEFRRDPALPTYFD